MLVAYICTGLLLYMCIDKMAMYGWIETCGRIPPLPNAQSKASIAGVNVPSVAHGGSIEEGVFYIKTV